MKIYSFEPRFDYDESYRNVGSVWLGGACLYVSPVDWFVGYGGSMGENGDGLIDEFAEHLAAKLLP